MKPPRSTFGDFRCAHCGGLVSSLSLLSGVHNRNHCPYCLWSCHLDLFAAGDRLSACKAPMRPVGLTLKRNRNKYLAGPGGELMLIHECEDCRTLSINRVAADDDLETLLSVFQASQDSAPSLQPRMTSQDILLLTIEHAHIVHARLYGQRVEAPVMG
jgi:hypothetical protein